jgi:hypothetical protein
VRQSLSKTLMCLPLEKGSEGKGKEVEREGDEVEEDKVENGEEGWREIVDDDGDKSTWVYNSVY